MNRTVGQLLSLWWKGHDSDNSKKKIFFFWDFRLFYSIFMYIIITKQPISLIHPWREKRYIHIKNTDKRSYLMKINVCVYCAFVCVCMCVRFVCLYVRTCVHVCVCINIVVILVVETFKTTQIHKQFKSTLQLLMLLLYFISFRFFHIIHFVSMI